MQIRTAGNRLAHWAIHSAEIEWVLSGVRNVTASDAFNGSAFAQLRRRHDLLFEDGGRGLPLFGM
jgi:hypothetical protein